MIVTTTEKAESDVTLRAQALARRLGAAYAPRERRTLSGLRRDTGADELIVVGPREVKLMREGEPPFFFHPSMALIRIKRLLGGGGDSLLAVAGAAPGDRVLDCTAGLCSDSLVFSFAVGEAGSVVGVEASAVIHAVVAEGLQVYESGLPEADVAMRRIELRHGSHLELLRGMAEGSFDIVYFDPMFEKPVTESSSLQPLRTLAAHEPLSAEAVREAKRVARRKVILKDHRDSGQFDRLGFARARVSTSAVGYGVIEIE